MIKLRHASAADLAVVVRQMYPRQVRVAEVATINALVVSGDRDSVAAVRDLVAQLDRARRQITYSLVHTGSRQQRDVLAELQVQRAAGDGSRAEPWRIGFDAKRRRQDTALGGVRTVVGLEGEKVSLTDKVTRVETLPSPWGPTGVVLEQTTGLWVRGVTAGDDEVTLTVGYGEGDARLESVVRVPVGTWVPLGGTDRNRAGDSAEGSWQSIGGSAGPAGGAATGRTGRGRQSDSGLDRYLIKVDLR